MTKLLWKLSLFIVLFFVSASCVYAQDDFNKIEAAITDYLKTDAELTKVSFDVSATSKTIQPNGSWPGIDYASTGDTNWAPLTHLNRLKQFALCVALKEKVGQHNGVLAAQLTAALRYWLQMDPRSNNWFQNDIASPTAIGEILLLTKESKTLPVSLRDSLVRKMRQGNVVKNVGSNKMDIAVHMIYRACLTGDRVLMDSAVTQAFLPITLSNKEGLQPDYSYRQHGPQLHIASYGQVFLTAEYKFASWLTGTSYALPTEKLKILDNYLINTYLKTIRGRYIDFNTEGRGISRNDLLDKFTITSKFSKHSLLALAKLVNPGNTGILNAAEQRLTQSKSPSFEVRPGHQFFYKSDYTLHNRPAYSFNVRTVSKRTIRTETGNKENLVGKFLPDGATNIQRTGDEYFNIMPVWEWDKIPGITARDYPKDQRTSLEWGERGVGEFTGGLSDGLYGVSVYQFDYNEVAARKSWFFFDNEVVCLGAGINSFAREPITTTVNQAWKRGLVKAFDGNKLIDAKEILNSKDIRWIWHDSVAYTFPNRGQLSLTAGKQTGSWVEVNANRAKDPVQGDVFKVWFNHGIDPVNATYAYLVRPGISLAEMEKNPTSPIRIIANNAAVQAVMHDQLGILQVVFYAAGRLVAEGYTVAVDQPCILQVRDITSATPTLSVADPAQKQTAISVSYSSNLLRLVDPVSVSMPQGEHKGATTSVKLNVF
ncbi:MAG: chondroitinase [Pedobacter sp.]|nr:MAG: chondroitinase [Pedobacter sp.]